ncbi:NADP-dependent aldehyde dehydrogenase [Brevibacterium sanguinis]|uniref:NADP-dependent aldehyde dehydrogenase n=2 Tax=Brevibacterium TaxID=1696 RepID=A0A366IJC0_9MICO|nr:MULTISPECIES: aldehyde dehydrogenase (NADP(+)) [Brevibacterium]RBP64976.1 NADP-dependent aldehyde dehydrogenase [Brevibacterium sanguinis]RBP71239.1 NADP-dependent aldehyde dehydrogenase [Brevibacterium celere]
MTKTELRGHSLIAGSEVTGRAGTAQAVDPRTNAPLDPVYTALDAEQTEEATRAAAAAFAGYRSTSPKDRSTFLDRIADNIDAVRAPLVERAMAETGLPEARLNGEVSRTVGQLRLFADVVRVGNFHGARIDPALPERSPLPRLDIRQRRVPIGPVAVFGASNFPLAFSVAGGDTASALAAGCPVVVKAHNAHPGTSEIVGRAVTAAAAECGIDPGVFSLVYGAGSTIGQQLAADPRIAAIGFTGSRSAGLSLSATAANRPVPIPVYAEMSSINPVIVLPGSLSSDGVGPEALASQFITSLTGSSGQLCTAPGLVLVPEGAPGDGFVDHVAALLPEQTGQTMLTPGIAEAFGTGVAALRSQPGVDEIASGVPGVGENAPAPIVFTTRASEFAANEALAQEIFGAASLVVRYRDAEELRAVLEGLEGQLTATVQATESDFGTVRALLPVLEGLCGRILWGGWPTGVEVGHAMVHGGPFPATSAPATTSVGSLAIERFLRPVSYQSMPPQLLPEPVRDDNPWSVVQLHDGRVKGSNP